jgi:hypothetical protein
VTSNRAVEDYQHFEGKFWPRLQGEKYGKGVTSKKQAVARFLLYITSPLRMEVLHSSETSGKFYRSTWRHIPEDGNQRISSLFSVFVS